MTPRVLSVVSPVYESASTVQELVRQIVGAASEATADFEIVLVDDGSRDDSWKAITTAAAADGRVKGIRLSRNFGQHRAISAGLANAAGDWVVVLDCDLQDDPRYIPAMMAMARDGFDIVLTRREARNHSWIRNVAAGMFIRAFNLLAERRIADRNIGGYSLISRKVVDAYLRIGDANRQYMLLLGWLGFRTAILTVEHRRRHSGRSAYGFRRLFTVAIDGVISYSTKLLRLSVGLGFAYFAAATAGLIYLIWQYFRHGFLAGWASTIVLLLGSTGLILLAIGVLGIYLGKVFEQVQGRPLYLVQDHCNFGDVPR